MIILFVLIIIVIVESSKRYYKWVVEESELEFEIQNENALIIVFNNTCDCGTLSQLTSSPTVDQCRRVFDLNKKRTKLGANHVLECVFNGNNNGNNSSDCCEKNKAWQLK